jgi:hypothetical protein
MLQKLAWVDVGIYRATGFRVLEPYPAWMVRLPSDGLLALADNDLYGIFHASSMYLTSTTPICMSTTTSPISKCAWIML